MVARLMSAKATRKARSRLFSTSLLLCAVSVSAEHPAVDESFEVRGMPRALTAHLGGWRVAGGCLNTVGAQPPAGWFVRARHAYDLGRLVLRIRKDRREGTVFVHLRHWMVILRERSVSVKLTHAQYDWCFYWNCIERAIDFNAGRWHGFVLSLDGKSLRIEWDGKSVVDWSSPRQEWEARLNKSRYGADAALRFPESFPSAALKGEGACCVVQAFDTRLSIDEIRIFGKDRGPAQGFQRLGDAYPHPYIGQQDWEIERLAPTEPVVVDWGLQENDAKEASALPAVDCWAIPDEHKVEIERESRDREKMKEPLDYFVGAAAPGRFPKKLEGPRFWPQAVNVHFNLKSDGLYTLKWECDGQRLGRGAQVYEVSVDGRPVSREVHRGAIGAYPVRDYVPLKLRKGPHRVQLRSYADHAKTIFWTMKHLNTPLEHVELAKGLHEPVFERDAAAREKSETRSEKALSAAPRAGEFAGKSLRFSIKGLPTRGNRVRMSFYDADVFEAGRRLMDVYVNGRLASQGLDVVAEAGGPLRLLEKAFEADATPYDAPIYRLDPWEWRGPRTEIERVTDAREGKFALRAACAEGRELLSPAVHLDQKAPAPIRFRLAAKLLKPMPGQKKTYMFGMSLKHVKFMDDTVKWESFLNAMAIDPEHTGWQDIQTVYRPKKPVKYFIVLLMLPKGADILIDDVTAVPLLPNGEPGNGQSLVPNGGFEVTPQDHLLDIRLVGRNFRAFLNAIRVEDPDGKVVFAENLGWTPGQEQLTRETYYFPKFHWLSYAAEPPKWTPEETFDGHNLIANSHFSLEDETRRGKPRYWYTGWDLPERNALATDFYQIASGKGAYALDASEGRSHPGAMRIGKTEKGFAVFGSWPTVDYGKRQRFTFWAKTSAASGRIFGELLWFAQDMEGGWTRNTASGPNSLSMCPRATPTLRLLGRSRTTEVLTGTHDWTRISVEAKPPFGAAFAAPLVHVDGNRSGTVWVDDAELNGYGAEPIEITYSHAGWHPLGDKTFVIKSPVRAPVKWEILRADDGDVLKSGEAVYHSHEWFAGRHYYRADVSALAEPGRYVLKATQGLNTAQTDPFQIDRSLYANLAKMLLGAIHLKRYNTDHPVAGPPEGLEDAYCVPTETIPRRPRFEARYLEKRRDTMGGYYDAGDWMKHVEFWPDVILALDNLRVFVEPIAERTEDDVRDELDWAIAAFHKFQRPDGLFYKACKPYHPKLENLPLYGLERYLEQIHAVAQAAPIVAMVSWQVRNTNPELCEKYRNIAVKNYTVNNERFHRYTETWRSGPQLVWASKALWTAMYLYKLTSDEIWRERCEGNLRKVIDGVKGGHYAAAGEHNSVIALHGGINQDYIVALTHYLRLFPETSARKNIHEAFRAYAARHRKLSETTIWGQALVQISDRKKPTRYCQERTFSYWAGLAHTLALIGMELRDPSTVRLADRQIQWLLGKNPADACSVHGIGTRWSASGDYLFRQPEFLRHWLKSGRKLYSYDGHVGTLAFRDDGKGEVKFSGGFWPPLYGRPKGYLAYYLQADYMIHPAPTEFYLPKVADLLNAATALHAALRQMASPAP